MKTADVSLEDGSEAKEIQEHDEEKDEKDWNENDRLFYTVRCGVARPIVH